MLAPQTHKVFKTARRVLQSHYVLLVCFLANRLLYLPDVPAAPRQKYISGWVLQISYAKFTIAFTNPPLILQGVSESAKSGL